MLEFMRKHSILIFALLFPFISCSNDSANKDGLAVDEDIVVEDGNSLFWKIEGKGVVTSYMYGTMHMINSEYYNMTEKMISKIQSSKAIIMEVGGMPNPVAAYQMMSLDTGTVHSYFTKEQMAVLLEFFDTILGTPPETFHKVYGGMKPFFILQSLSQGYFDEGAKSYDLDIMSLAAEKDIPLVGLETIEDQLGFFDNIPQEKMAEMIMIGIEDYEDEKKSTKKLMKLYHSQKVNKLIPMMNKQSPEFMEFSDIFLYDRNKKWIPKITSEIADKQCFIAVGAAHLFGDGGVIDLLKKEGYTVTAISTE